MGGPLVNFHMLAEEKLPLHARRRHEMQILKHLQPALQNFNSRVQVSHSLASFRFYCHSEQYTRLEGVSPDQPYGF